MLLFVKEYSGLYNAIRKHGWERLCLSHMHKKRINTHYTIDIIIEATQNYSDTNTFVQENKRMMKWLSHNGYALTKIAPHLKKKNPKRRIAIVQLSLDGIELKEWSGAVEAADALNISNKGIFKCCNGQSKSYKGFKWRYKK